MHYIVVIMPPGCYSVFLCYMSKDCICSLSHCITLGAHSCSVGYPSWTPKPFVESRLFKIQYSILGVFGDLYSVWSVVASADTVSSQWGTASRVFHTMPPESVMPLSWVSLEQLEQPLRAPDFSWKYGCSATSQNYISALTSRNTGKPECFAHLAVTKTSL